MSKLFIFRKLLTVLIAGTHCLLHQKNLYGKRISEFRGLMDAAENLFMQSTFYYN
jgi:hypothetical protein